MDDVSNNICYLELKDTVVQPLEQINSKVLITSELFPYYFPSTFATKVQGLKDLILSLLDLAATALEDTKLLCYV